MRILNFKKEQGKSIHDHDSQGASVVHLLQNTPTFVVTIYLEPGVVLGVHTATADQLFLVVAGSGQALAGEERCQLSPGTAVLWQSGEEHETRAGSQGLTAVVVEGKGLIEALAPQLVS